MSAKLTDRQQEILDYIKSEMQQERTPNYGDVADRFGFSIQAARDHINALIKKKYLSAKLFRKRHTGELVEPTITRSVVFDRIDYNPNFEDTKRDMFEIPVYDPILDQEPYFEDDNVVGVLTIPFDNVKYFRNDIIGFTYNSLSMAGSGFRNGDALIAKKIRIAESNDIVLVNVHGQNLLRRVFLQGTYMTLLSNTDGVDPQSYEIKDVTVICKYIGLQRWIK